MCSWTKKTARNTSWLCKIKDPWNLVACPEDYKYLSAKFYGTGIDGEKKIINLLTLSLPHCN